MKKKSVLAIIVLIGLFWLSASQSFAGFPEKMINNASLELRGKFIAPEIKNLNFIEFKGSGKKIVQEVLTNSGIIKITDTTVIYNKAFINNGGYFSDPSKNYFNDLIVGETGVMTGQEGDVFFVGGDFIWRSAMNTQWLTNDARLEFIQNPETQHQFYIPGADLGPQPVGYIHNFAWAQLYIASGNALVLQDGNNTPGGALYVEEIAGATVTGTYITNITGNNINIYYAADFPVNAYLAGNTYDFESGGQLIPVHPYCHETDTDLDGICDLEDNCPLIPNPGQADDDNDGHGNMCPLADYDADFDVDGKDLAQFIQFFFSESIEADLVQDSIIDSLDLAKFAREFGWADE